MIVWEVIAVVFLIAFAVVYAGSVAVGLYILYLAGRDMFDRCRR